MSLVGTPKTVKKSARRCLFGRPTPEQQESTRQWLDQTLEELIRRDCEKWGFNFKLGVPLDEASCSLYAYDSISESEVPQFYRSKHISVATPLTSPSTSEKEISLMDVSSCTESDISMDFEPVPPSKRIGQTPKKRQNKMTDYAPIRRKKTQRSPKESPILRNTPSPSRSPRGFRAARHF